MGAIIGFFIVAIIIAGIGLAVAQASTENKFKTANRPDNPKTLDNEQKILDELRQQDFQETQCLILGSSKIRIDENNEDIAICYNQYNEYYIIPFAKIREISIYEDGIDVKKSAIKRAVIGGLLAGDAGAIVGASTAKDERVINSYGLNLYTKNISRPLHTFHLIVMQTKKDSFEYTTAKMYAESAFAVLNAIIAQSSESR